VELAAGEGRRLSQRAAGRWRGADGTLGPPSGAAVIVVEFAVIGDLFHADKCGQISPDYDRQITGRLHVSGEDAEGS
jgi:hypothetical protein